MIISVSRRTDIPAFYSEWFFNRLKAGYVDVINPFNSKQANRISLTKKDVDCFVFWTKNPISFLSRLDELNDYNYYFQFTLNSYGTDLEPNVPSKSNVLIDAFIKLSKAIGKEKVIWRYDPVILTNKYTREWHVKYFEKIAKKLSGHTEKCVFSFVDIYIKTKRNTKDLGMKEITKDDMIYIAFEFSKIAKKYNIELSTCCEEIDLHKYDIKHNSCVDGVLIEKMFGLKLNEKLDKQRKMCGCLKCVDIGAYNTCLHGCKYCYASYNNDVVTKNLELHNPYSSTLIGELKKDVKIYEKKGENQISLFD